MPNGFENPYITETGNIEFNIEDWLNEEYMESLDPGDQSAWFSPISGIAPYTYEYQGMNPEIMSALGNVFQGGDVVDLFDFSHDIWSQDDIDTLLAMGIDSDAAGTYLTHAYTGGAGPYEESGLPETDPAFWEGSVQLGGPGTFFTDFFNPESIASTLSALGGLEGEAELTAAEVKALTPGMVDKTTGAYYDPYEVAERKELIEKKGKARAEIPTGGFAGSGQRMAGLSAEDRLYKGGYTDLLSDIMKMKSSATENVLETIFGWQELI